MLFVPTYKDPADNRVLKLLEANTGVEVVGVDCSMLIRAKGQFALRGHATLLGLFG